MTASVDHAALRHVHVGEMGMRVVERHLYCAGGCCPSSANLSSRVFEAMRQFNADLMRFAGDSIADRLTARLNDAGDLQSCRPPIHVHLELDLGEDRLMDGLEGGGEDLKDRRSRLGVLTAHDAEQALPLFGSRSPVDDRH